MNANGETGDAPTIVAAHSANRCGRWEPLDEHLHNVARLASLHASPLGLGEEARAAGLLHDLGKLGDPFQDRLHGLGSGLDHWSPGAWVALTHYRQAGIPIALAVQGHHVGLQRWDAESLRGLDPKRLTTNHPLGLRLSLAEPAKVLEYFAANEIILPNALRPASESEPHLTAMVDTRVLYSCLVDADFLATESHFEAPSSDRRYVRPDGPPLQPDRALRLVLEAIDGLRGARQASPAVQGARDDVLAACLDSAERPPGLFTLTAPTGCGKTLAMLAFALKHAAVHGLRRVVIVVPYLSIIEQTGEILRKLFGQELGDHYVLEHHSLATDGGDSAVDRKRADWASGPTGTERILTENWDAPVILTTNVQLLESLFSNRPGACRKLHRLGGAVLLFDEVQTLPAGLAVPTLGALGRHSERYRTSVVFATATQPAFGHLDNQVRQHSRVGWRPTEIVRNPAEVFRATRRVEVEWPDLSSSTSWTTLAARLRDAGTAICVVNLKRHAQELVFALQDLGVESVLHLSTSMCPAHRSRTLDTVRHRLRSGEPCLLVSTQCVEAGVDIDFPAAFRALGPLEAIAQVAGRCNRHGTRDSPGRLVVFIPQDEKYPPGGGYSQAASTTRVLLRELGADELDIGAPGIFEAYYRRLYDLIDIANAKPDLADAIRRRDFPAVCRAYRIVDQDAVNLIVPYDLAKFESLRLELGRGRPLSRDWVRRARPLAINFYRAAMDRTPNLEPIVEGDGEATDWYAYIEPSHYSTLLGLSVPEGPEMFVQ